jgi:hypothetical protein
MEVVGICKYMVEVGKVVVVVVVEICSNMQEDNKVI